MKRTLLCTLVLTGAMCVTAFAAPTISVDNKPVENSEVIEIDGSDYFPVRAVAEAMGLSVEWQGDTKSVVITNGGPIYITFTVGQNGYTFAKTAPIQSVGAPVISDKKTYIPVDVLSDIAGMMVEKNDENYNIVLAQNTENSEETTEGIVINTVGAAENTEDEENTEEPQGFGGPVPYDTATGIVKEVDEEHILFTDDKRGDVLLTKGGDVKVTDSDGNSVDVNDIKVDDKLSVDYGDAMTMSIPPINNPKTIVVEK